MTLTSGLESPRSMIDAVERRNNAFRQADQIENKLAVAWMIQGKAKINAEAKQVRASGLTKVNLQKQYIETLRITPNSVIIKDGKTPAMMSR